MLEDISVKEAAARWNIAERTVTGLCKNGSIPGAIKKGRYFGLLIRDFISVKNFILDGF